jgi:hypothetical protein
MPQYLLQVSVGCCKDQNSRSVYDEVQDSSVWSRTREKSLLMDCTHVQRFVTRRQLQAALEALWCPIVAPLNCKFGFVKQFNVIVWHYWHTIKLRNNVFVPEPKRSGEVCATPSSLDLPDGSHTCQVAEAGVRM